MEREKRWHAVSDGLRHEDSHWETFLVLKHELMFRCPGGRNVLPNPKLAIVARQPCRKGTKAECRKRQGYEGRDGISAHHLCRICAEAKAAGSTPERKFHNPPKWLLRTPSIPGTILGAPEGVHALDLDRWHNAMSVYPG